jgi:hypothetical protein
VPRNVAAGVVGAMLPDVDSLVPYLVAALVASVLAGLQQAGQLSSGTRLPRSWPALSCWAQRLGAEAALALVGLGLVDVVQLSVFDTRVADHPLGGIVVALATALGARSTTPELPEQVFRLHTEFRDWRKRLTLRLRTLQAAEGTDNVIERVIPAAHAAELSPEDVAQRIRLYLAADPPGISDAQKATELDLIQETLDEDATPAREQVTWLIERAFELGGDALVDRIKSDAERREDAP